MKILAAAAMSLSLLDPAGAQTNESSAATGSAINPPEVVQTLSISRSGSRPPSQGSAENFTGSVRVDPLFRTDDLHARPAPTSRSRPVRVPPGTPTRWARR